MTLETVKVPKAFEAIFTSAEHYVQGYFKNRIEDPKKGIIEIQGERYILVRAASLSVHFLDFIKAMYPALDENESMQAAAVVLFDLAHGIGKADARAFHQKMKVTDPIEKLSTGPIHFAYSGWAFVDIHPESRPSPDQNFYLLYDHPQSFEADSWIAQKKSAKFCTCFMNAGYSSGWCQESFGVTLSAKEILCRAKGDPFCRFIMAPPERIDSHLEAYKKQNPDFFK